MEKRKLDAESINYLAEIFHHQVGELSKSNQVNVSSKEKRRN